MYLTPYEACEMLADDRADDFRLGLVEGRYQFEDKYIKHRTGWRTLISWSWLRIEVPTRTQCAEVMDDDGRTVLRIE